MEQETNYGLTIQPSTSVADFTEVTRANKVEKRINQFNTIMSSLRGRVDYTSKWIIAFNKTFGREFSQFETYSTDGFSTLTSILSDHRPLANNNIHVNSLNSVISDSRDVYVCLEPPRATEKTGIQMSVAELIEKSVESYEEIGYDYNLKVYFNTDDYDEYTILKEQLDQLNLECTLLNSVEQKRSMEGLHVINEIAAGSLAPILDDFISGLKIPSKSTRTFLDPEVFKNTKITYSEIWLAGYQQMDLGALIPDTSYTSIIHATATRAWLNPSPYKFDWEHIRDFLSCPTAIFIRGLSPFFGCVTDRLIKVKMIRVDTNEPVIFDLGIRNPNTLTGLDEEDRDLLKKLLIEDSRNTRDKLVRYKMDDGEFGVFRIENIDRILKVSGSPSNAPRIITKFELKNKFKNLFFVSPFYFANVHNKYSFGGKAPFRLPNDYITYLKRKAKRKGDITIPGEDWFRLRNSKLVDVLAMFEDYRMDRVVEKFIDPVNGVSTPSIGIDWRDLR